jgi:hypothetical protein
MKRFLSMLAVLVAVLVMFSAFAYGLEATGSASPEATASLRPVSAKRPHATRHRPHKVGKHRRNRHHRMI